MESILRKREIPQIIVFVIAITMVAEYWFAGVKPVASQIRFLGIYIVAFTLIIGGINLFRRYINTISKRTEGEWQLSVWFFIVYIVMTVPGLVPPIGTHSLYSWMFTYMKIPLDATVYSILAFFIFTAIIRTFKVKNFGSLLLVSSSIFVMLRNAPIGATFWKGFPIIGTWVSDIVMSSGMRGIVLGVAIGSMGVCIRILMGWEKGALGGAE